MWEVRCVPFVVLLDSSTEIKFADSELIKSDELASRFGARNILNLSKRQH